MMDLSHIRVRIRVPIPPPQEVHPRVPQIGSIVAFRGDGGATMVGVVSAIGPHGYSVAPRAGHPCPWGAGEITVLGHTVTGIMNAEGRFP